MTAPSLVEVARAAIRHYSRTRKVPRHDREPGDPPPSGVFVSLHEQPSPGQVEGPLRGCIGTYEPREPNVRSEVAQAAVAAAYSDPRFPAMRSEEIEDLEIAVYLLAPPEPVHDLADLDPSRFGVIVEGGGRRGLLLPAIPGIDTVDRQLAIARQKAGLSPDDTAEIQRFEATILH